MMQVIRPSLSNNMNLVNLKMALRQYNLSPLSSETNDVLDGDLNQCQRTKSWDSSPHVVNSCLESHHGWTRQALCV